MKKILTKLLLVSLLFSAVMPAKAFFVPAPIQQPSPAPTTPGEAMLLLFIATLPFSVILPVAFLTATFGPFTKQTPEPKVDRDLKHAIKNGNIAQVKQILIKNPLIWGKNLFLREIIKARRNFTALRKPYDTPLMYAARFGNLEIIKLLDQRFDPWRNNMPRSYIIRRIYNNYNRALIIAAKNGHTEVAKFLLKKKAHINVQDNNGESLRIAVKHGHPAVVKLLLEYSADVNARDNNGQTALMIAAEYSHAAKQQGNSKLQNKFNEIITLLLTFGANPLLKDFNDKSVLDQCDNEIIRQLMQQQALLKLQ